MKLKTAVGSLAVLFLIAAMTVSPAYAEAPKYDMTGTWDVQLTRYWESCPDPSPPDDPSPVTINQSGSTFTLYEDGEISSGTIDGNRYRIWEYFSKDGGKVSFTRQFYLSTPSSATGNWTQTWSNGSSICSWGGDVVMKKQTQYSCTPSDTQACLNKGRYAVSVTWRNQQGQTGVGHVAPGGSDDSGMFWFFNESNWEMLIKVLNACGTPSKHYWVFFAATTDQEFTVTVTDTKTNDVVEYTNPLKNPADAVTDTSAFATCP